MGILKRPPPLGDLSFVAVTFTRLGKPKIIVLEKISIVVYGLRLIKLQNMGLVVLIDITHRRKVEVARMLR